MGTYDAGEDREWIEETLTGNPEAFGQLVQKHHPLLFQMACRVLKNPQEAEDAVQEGFTQAFRHLAEFKHQSQFATWVYTIVLNRIRNMLRHSKVLRIYSLDMPRPTRDGQSPVEVMENSPGPEEIVENQLEREALRRAAKSLPPIHRDIFAHYYFDNCSIAEIAEKVSRPEGTVKVYLHRARQGLTRDLQKGLPAARMPD